MTVLTFANYTQVGPSQGSNQGGLYEHDQTGERYYMKYPASERQGKNERLASALYRAMGFDALDYVTVDNGMIATEWREGLPNTSDVDDLRGSTEALETFAPSALLGNWDVVGLVYDNLLYDPASMARPVLLDFGGSFDTRAQGGAKPYRPDTIMALDGFTDATINRSATRVFEVMDARDYRRSVSRVERLGELAVEQATRRAGLDPARRASTIMARRERLLETAYDEVF